MDLGADRRGVDMGPFAVRYARLREGLQALGIPTTLDHGNIPVPVPEAASVADQHAKYLPIILAVCEELAQLAASGVPDPNALSALRDRYDTDQLSTLTTWE